METYQRGCTLARRLDNTDILIYFYFISFLHDHQQMKLQMMIQEQTEMLLVTWPVTVMWPGITLTLKLLPLLNIHHQSQYKKNNRIQQVQRESFRGERGDESVTTRMETERTSSSSRTEIEPPSLSSEISGNRSAVGIHPNTQSSSDSENVNQSTGQEDIAMETDDRVSPPPDSPSQANSLLSPSSHAGISSRNGFLTSSHSGVSSQRTPSRVVRVRRSYDGPELVQVRVISERFEGVGDRPPRISAEDLR